MLDIGYRVGNHAGEYEWYSDWDTIPKKVKENQA